MTKTSYASLDTFLSTDNLADFLRLVRTIPAATKERNSYLAELVQNGDLGAREQMIIENLRLVSAEALKNTSNLSTYEKLDLIQDGFEGLIKAVDLFDPNEGCCLLNLCCQEYPAYHQKRNSR